MTSLQSLRDRRNLESFLGILPGEPSCDSYPTMNMTPREVHEAYPEGGKTQDVKGGELVGILVYNLKTRKMTVRDPSEQVAVSHV